MITEIISVAAILASPLIALQVGQFLNEKKEKRERRINVFKALMVTRGTIFSPRHVEALNSIETEFCGHDSKDQAVREAWKTYHDHLSSGPEDTATNEEKSRWSENSTSFRVDLLYVMSKALSYSFDKVDINRKWYTPSYSYNIEQELNAIRGQLVRLLNGEISIPVQITIPEGTELSQETLAKLLIDQYKNKIPFPVVIIDKKNTI